MDNDELQGRIDHHVDAAHRGGAIDTEDLIGLTYDVDWDDTGEAGGRFVSFGDVPAPTPEDFNNAGIEGGPGAVARWQQWWVESTLAETSEEPWWGIQRLIASDGREAFVATIRSGYSLSGLSAELVGIFVTRSQAHEAIEALGHTTQF